MELLPDRASNARTREEIMESEPPPEPRVPVDTNSELHKKARQVGTIAGQAVALVRDARRKAGQSQADLGSKARNKIQGLRENAAEQINELRETATQRANELGEAAAARINDLRETTAAKADEWRRVAQQRSSDMARWARIRLELARARANRLGHNYPWHFVVAGTIVGFLVGAALRVRRANRGY